MTLDKTTLTTKSNTNPKNKTEQQSQTGRKQRDGTDCRKKTEGMIQEEIRCSLFDFEAVREESKQMCVLCTVKVERWTPKREEKGVVLGLTRN